MPFTSIKHPSTPDSLEYFMFFILKILIFLKKALIAHSLIKKTCTISRWSPEAHFPQTSVSQVPLSG